MPAIYAHDRFGQDVIERVGGTVKELIQIERAAFDIGLQGPDLLFYYRPLLPNDIRKIGSRIHGMSGRRFFGRCVSLQRENPDDAMLAYLLGSLCHFVLDSHLHPQVERRCAQGDVVHTEVEMSFDRSLMVEDGLDPLTTALGANLETDELPVLAEGIRLFYPPLSARQIERAVRSMAGYQRLLLAPTEGRRALLAGALCVTGPHRRSLMGHVMSREPVAALRGSDERLRALYQEALEQVPERMEELLLWIYQKKSPGAAFDKNYEGEAVNERHEQPL